MVTIRDVARAAGVSVATVSRVYNSRDLVAEDTWQRVHQAAQRLGYSPHAAARSLITRRTHTLGVLLPDLYGEFFSEVIRGIDHAAKRGGYHLLVASAHDEQSEFESALRAMRGRVDGLIVMAPGLDAAAARRSLPEEFPVILLNSPPSDAGYGSLTVANYEGARAMVSHLIALGHRRLAIITGGDRNFDARERLRGFRDAQLALGIQPQPELELAGDFREASGYAAGRLLSRMPDRPTAVFAANDCMALGALFAFREAGLAVPTDLALAGFDDIPMGRYVDPALTSVHVDISALGTRATARLLEALQQPAAASSSRETLPATLVVRRSCGGNHR